MQERKHRKHHRGKAQVHESEKQRETHRKSDDTKS